MTNAETRAVGTRGFSKDVHDYYAHYADNADAKIGALIGLNLAVAGFSLGAIPTHGTAELLAWGAVALHCFAGGGLLFGIYPRLDKTGSGFLFWDHVRQYDTAHLYREAVLKLRPDEAEAEFAENNYVVAGILRKKFRAIRIALWFTTLALALEVSSVITA